MQNRKLLVGIFLSALILAYSALWYYLANKMRDILIDKENVRPQNIILSGYPFDIQFKLKESAKNTNIKKVSFNILNKKLLFKLRPGIFANSPFNKELRFRDKKPIFVILQFDSYLKLLEIVQNSNQSHLIDMFNACNKLEVTANIIFAGALADDEEIEGKFALSLPDKKQYKTSDDLLKDIPKNMDISISYTTDSHVTNRTPDFTQALTKLVNPASGKIDIKASFPADKIIDISNVEDKDSFINILSNMKLLVTADGDTPLSNSTFQFTMTPGADAQNVNLSQLFKYKPGMLEKFYNSVSKENLVDILIFSLQTGGTQLSDEAKMKLYLLSGKLYEIIFNDAKLDKDYWNKQSQEGSFRLSFSVPYKEGIGAMKYSLGLSHGATSLMNLEGDMQGSGIPKSTTGRLYLNDKEQGVSKSLGLIRLAIFAFNPSVSVDDFKVALSNFNEFEKLVETNLLALSDNPETKTADLNYSYNIDMQNAFGSKISASNKTLADLVGFGSLLFMPLPKE